MLMHRCMYIRVNICLIIHAGMCICVCVSVRVDMFVCVYICNYVNVQFVCFFYFLFVC